MQVNASESSLVRLFLLDLPPNEAMVLREQPSALAALIGIDALEDGQWELFDLADLAGLGLEGYLEEGHGISAADLAPYRWQIDALEGVVLILRSAAITTRPATLTPRAPLRWIATFGEDRPPVPLHSNLRSASAEGGLAATTSQPRSARGSLAVVVLGLVLTAAIALAIFLLARGPT